MAVLELLDQPTKGQDVQDFYSFSIMFYYIISTISVSTIPDIVRFKILLNSTNYPIQNNFYQIHLHFDLCVSIIVFLFLG